MAAIDRIPAFALPFVTRSLRGGRGRRFVALSLALALLTALVCLGIGLGDSRLARELRVEIGIEMSLDSRERHDFIVLDDDDENLRGKLVDRQAALRSQGFEMLVAASVQQAPLEHADLQRDARALAVPAQFGMSDSARFSWGDPVAVHRLGKFVEYGGEPPIVAYTSTVGLHETLQLLAMVTGGLLIVLLTVLAPLLVALQQASERHENTLQPLTGTALGAIELCVGLACGPLAIVAIFAAPIAALYLAAALAIGELGSLWLVPLLVGTATGLVLGAQLFAHLVGARRAPGMIAVALLCLLGLLGLASMGMASTLQREVLGISAVLPQTGSFALLGESFGDPWRATALAHVYRHIPNEPIRFAEILAPALVGMVSAAMLGLLALRALARHLEGRATLLDASEALLGALICIGMVDVAIPSIERYEPLHQTIGLPMLALPFFLLIMARVPIGDVPTKLRGIPLARLLGEFAGWTVIHVSLAALIDVTSAGLHPIPMLGIAWCATVMVLLAVRLVATPSRILGTAWVAVCVGMLLGTFVFTSLWAFHDGPPLRFMLNDFEALLLWGALVFVVPISLVRHLRRHVAALR